MGWLSENFDKDLRLRTYVQSICGNQAFLLHYIPPRIRGGGLGRMRSRPSKIRETVRPSAPKYGESGKTETCASLGAS